METNINYIDKGYSNGWTTETIDSFLRKKLSYYWTLDKAFQARCPLLSYLGLTEDEYHDWIINDRVHSRVTRIWPMPSYNWNKES
jgi:hypothetical protein